MVINIINMFLVDWGCKSIYVYIFFINNVITLTMRLSSKRVYKNGERGKSLGDLSMDDTAVSGFKYF